jgi:5-methylcytosine-specific restriction endonuclease McrA
MDHKLIAAELMQNPIFKTSSWSALALTVWLRDNCKCVYCGKNMLESYDIAYHSESINLLLPKFWYPQVKDKDWNNVLTCRECNCIKRSWDPNRYGSALYIVGNKSISDENRSQLITRASEYIRNERTKRQSLFELERELILNHVSKDPRCR